MSEASIGERSATNGDVKACYCYVCDRLTNAVQCEDCELRCVNCQSTSVECVEDDTSNAVPPPPSSSSGSSRRSRSSRFTMRPRGSRRNRMPSVRMEDFLQERVTDVGRFRSTRHLGVICDGCDVRDFSGTRYRCLECRDYDLCSECYGRVNDVHPAHRFEAIETPDPQTSFRSRLAQAFTRARALRQSVIAVLEIGIEEVGESRSGLKDADVAWWLAQDQCLVDEESMKQIDPSWSCLICCEGLDALDENGWVVSICGSSANKVQDGQPCVGDAEGVSKDSNAEEVSVRTVCGEDEAALQDELQSLEYTALLNRARAGGASNYDVDVVSKDDDPKTALIALIAKQRSDPWDTNESQRTQLEEGDASDSKKKDASSSSIGHIFHEGCLRRWVLKNNSCPVCRRAPVVPEAVSSSRHSEIRHTTI